MLQKASKTSDMEWAYAQGAIRDYPTNLSQAEVLRCLMLLGGSGSHAELTELYNHMHFPRNTNYKMLTLNEVKKTLQGDTAKLLRDRMITREYRIPSKRDLYKQHRKYAHYTITKYGHKYINTYRICEPLEIQK